MARTEWPARPWFHRVGPARNARTCDRYLEVTYRKGKPVAAYLYLPRDLGATATRTEDAGNGLRIDYDATGKALGIELTAPGLATAEHVNAVMLRLGHDPLQSREWAPLEAA